MSTRSCIENSGDFSAFTRIATMMRSNSRAPRRMMSTWPLVSGSNDPGYTARVGITKPGARRQRSDGSFVEGERAVAGSHIARSHQPSGALGGRLPPRVLDHGDPAGREQVGHGRELRIGRVIVWWIEQRDVECQPRSAQLIRRAGHLCADDSIAVLDAAEREVLGDERLRAAIAFDERNERRAATQRFDSRRARAGVTVEHARARDARRENIEQRFTKLVGCRAQALPRRRLESMAL